MACILGGPKFPHGNYDSTFENSTGGYDDDWLQGGRCTGLRACLYIIKWTNYSLSKRVLLYCLYTSVHMKPVTAIFMVQMLQQCFISFRESWKEIVLLLYK